MGVPCVPFRIYFVNDKGLRMSALEIRYFFFIHSRKESASCSIAVLFNCWYMEGHLGVHKVAWGIITFFIILF